MDYGHKLARILAWARNHPEFDGRLVRMLDAALKRQGRLGLNQELAVDHIILEYGIPMSDDAPLGYGDKVARILDWSRDHKEFDAGLIRLLAAVIKKDGQLGLSQEMMIDHIIEQYSIPMTSIDKIGYEQKLEKLIEYGKAHEDKNVAALQLRLDLLKANKVLSIYDEVIIDRLIREYEIEL